MLNYRRGYQRIVFVLSVLIAFAISMTIIFDIYTVWEYESREYENAKMEYQNVQNQYNDIAQFWLIWDSDGWTGGKKGIIRHILDSDCYAGFDFGDKQVYLNYSEVFPEITRSMLWMSEDALNAQAAQSKQSALEKAQRAIEVAENGMNYYRKQGTKSQAEVFSELAIVASIVAIFACLFVYAILWFGGVILYKIFLWCVTGFCEVSKTHNTSS
jgi:hypothetical protein